MRSNMVKPDPWDRWGDVETGQPFLKLLVVHVMITSWLHLCKSPSNLNKIFNKMFNKQLTAVETPIACFVISSHQKWTSHRGPGAQILWTFTDAAPFTRRRGRSKADKFTGRCISGGFSTVMASDSKGGTQEIPRSLLYITHVYIYMWVCIIVVRNFRMQAYIYVYYIIYTLNIYYTYIYIYIKYIIHIYIYIKYVFIIYIYMYISNKYIYI